ncbi:MAG: SDR family oxidoreductase [Rhizobiales bacterium]|nr:SDR family oxidoreductase [Hyphomicrobiales bacterium]NRB15435.1 SDR family oxidoreductase [Hyphomicrobiales bacterium]
MQRKTETTHNFNKQCAVVTGGAQGIGGAVATRLAASGARVAIWDIEPDAIAKAEAAMGPSVKGFIVDISDEASVAAGLKATEKWAGSISILVNSAGIAGPNATVADYDTEAWRLVQKINVDGTFFTNRAVVPGFVKAGYGRIVNVASVAGKEGNPNASAYSASKAAVIGLTKSLGKELAGMDIAVNCVTPAAARTRIFDQMKQEHIDYMLSKIPRGRFLEVEEAAAMICWLVTAENSFTTASVFDLSGGRATY